MTKYGGWIGKEGPTDQPTAFGRGRELLGRLAKRRESPGVNTLATREIQADGTLVEARFDGNIPRVRVTPAGAPEPACELYVESGLLDLGMNIASDAGERFNRGLPQFDDAPATLHFGDGVECEDGKPGFNGLLRIMGRQFTSQCLPKKGDSISSRLKDPVKKQAQALLPASCWSGLMQRYVQAVYGGAAQDYSASTTALTISGSTIQATASVGLVAVDGLLRFVVFDPATGSMDVHLCEFKNACFAACIAMWRSMPEDDAEEKARKRKVLSIALSGCRPGKLVSTIALGISGNTHFTRRPAMHFAEDGKTAAVVLESGKIARAYRVDFTRDDSELHATPTLLSSGAVINAASDVWELLVADDPSPFGTGGANRSGFEGDESIATGANYDFPVYAVFVGTDLRLVRYTFIVSTNVIHDLDSCGQGSDTSPLPAQLGGAPCSSNIASFPLIVSGYFCTGSGGTVWSSVETSRILNVAESGGGSSDRYIKREVWSKSLSVVATADETETSFVHDPWAFYPTTLRAIFSGYVGPALSYDCLINEDANIVYNYSISWSSDSCSLTQSSTQLDCAGPSEGGFPGTYAESTCEFRYATDNDATSSATSYAKVREARATALYVAGELYAPMPHVISMCSGSYEFVVDRYSLSRLDGVYADHQEDFTALIDARVSAEFTANIYLVTATLPGETLCTSDLETHTFQEALSGSYSTAYGNRREYYQVEFNQYIGVGAISGAPSRKRGTEKYASRASYGETMMVNGAITFNVTTDAAEDFEAVGAEVMIESCPYVERLFIESLDHDPIKTITATSDGDEVEWGDFALGAIQACVLDGFSYACATSLLGAKVLHTLQLERGSSIHMDRQTITGGYPTVSTPSFVGWA